MSRLNKQQIVDKVDHATEEVEVPEWGGTVLVGSMSMADRKDLVAYMEKHGKVAAQCWLVSRCMKDPVMTPEELMEKNTGPIDLISKVCMRLSGVTEDDQKAIERSFR